MPILVQLDDRIRNTATALMLTRFASEQPHLKKHPLVPDVLTYIQNFQTHPFIQLVNQLSTNWWMDKFYTLAVSIESDNGSFNVPMNLHFQFPSDYPGLFYQFCRDAKLSDLWKNSESLWSNTITNCTNLLQKGLVEEFLTLLFGSTKRNLILVPNPLDPPSFGFGVSNSINAFSIIAPPAIPNSDKRKPFYSEWHANLPKFVIHEFAHSLLASSADHAQLIKSTEYLANQMKFRGYFSHMYSNCESQLNEIIIRAIEAVYIWKTEGQDAAEKRLVKEESDFGITLIRPIFDYLLDFVKQRQHGDMLEINQYFLNYLP